MQKEFSLKSDAEFTILFQFYRKLGLNLKKLEAYVSLVVSYPIDLALL